MPPSAMPGTGTGTGADPEFTNIEYMDTIAAYDKWAEVYDTDGNFLQALDTLEMKTLLPEFLSLVASSSSGDVPADRSNCKVVDLGCGTGRNTLALCLAAPAARIVGLEPSSKMLDVARTRVIAQQQEQQDDGSGGSVPTGNVSFEIYNILSPPSSSNSGTNTTESVAPAPSPSLNADGIISTLVLEHVPTSVFFSAASSMLRPGGILLLTNMHSDMGAISQAGFVDPETKVKIRPTSYAHTAAEVVNAARAAGFERVGDGGDGDMKEVSVDEEMAGKLGPRSQKWVGVKVWYGACFRKI